MAPPDLPGPLQYHNSIYKAGLHYQQAPFTFRTSHWDQLAKEKLSASAYGYVHGNAGTNETYEKNRAAFRRWSIVPRRLHPPSTDGDGNPQLADSSTTVLGEKMDFPIVAAPVGVLRIFNPEGEIACAKAARDVGVHYIMSTASATPIEDVAAASGNGHRWYQLYWPSNEHNDITVSILDRAKKAGFTALVVTLDTYMMGWRPLDLDNGYNPFIHADHIGVAVGLSDPVFQQHFKKKFGYSIDDAAHTSTLDVEGSALGDAAREWTSIVIPGHSHSWDDIAFLQRHWDGPVVLKGIQTVADARRAAEAGVQGIVVSNHGGRQQDGGVASLAVLPAIVDAVGDKLDVLFDSGVRSGTDAIKALALGAKCVLVGRPYVYGLAIGGEEGVKHVLRSLAGEIITTMHVAGIRNLKELNRDVLVKEEL